MFTGDKMPHLSPSASHHRYVDTFAVSLAVEFAAVAADVLSDGLMQSELPLLFGAAAAHRPCLVCGAPLLCHTCETHVES